MYEYGILTTKSAIVYATKRNAAMADVPNKPEIYHKDFDVVEFIGEELATIRGVNSNHYFPVSFLKPGDVRKKSILFDNENTRVGSYSFCEDGKAYLVASTLTLGMPDKSFESIFEWCKDENNKKTFLKQNLEMFGLDIYMCQQDRPLNCYYVFDEFERLSLGPMFDYEESLEMIADDDFEYRSDFVYLGDIDDYHEMMVKYPQLVEILKSYLDVDLVNVIKSMAVKRNFDVSGLDLDLYKRFDEQSHKRLEKILK